MVSGRPTSGLQVIRPDLDVHLRVHSVAASTLNKDFGALKFWHSWAAANHVDPWLFWLSEDAKARAIRAFVTDTYSYGLTAHTAVRHSTISNGLAGVRHFFAAFGLSFPTHNPQVRMTLHGIGRVSKPRSNKAPVSVELMESCLQSIDLAYRSGQVLWGVLCLSFFFLLRRFDIAARIRTKFQRFVPKAVDITVTDAGGKQTLDPAQAVSVRTVLHCSKTNQAGAAVIRALSRSGRRLLCPVLGAPLCLKARKRLPAILHVAMFSVDLGGIASVSGYDVTAMLKGAAARIGVDPSEYSSRILCAGGATMMYRAGIDSLTIQFRDWWLSGAYKIYTSLCTESVNDIAAKTCPASTATVLCRCKHKVVVNWGMSDVRGERSERKTWCIPHRNHLTPWTAADSSTGRRSSPSFKQPHFASSVQAHAPSTPS
ncbi:hypothetical protein PybrP1_002258 [[Pythium] brassicae (nom. inval.)]|nr:hypothetical protein PybrP1_002258 [[Pythium] brassicae (nom. inval.)]